MPSAPRRFFENFSRFVSKASKEDLGDAYTGATHSCARTALEPTQSGSLLEGFVGEGSRTTVKGVEEEAVVSSLVDAKGGGNLAFDVPPEIDFGRFSWDETQPLGEGGLGVVFRGHVWGEDKGSVGGGVEEVAVKRCQLVIASGDNRVNLSNEVYNLYKLGTGDHAGMLKFVGYADDDKHRYIVTERLRGPSLFDALCGGNTACNPVKFLEVLHQVFVAVAHMHNLGFAHYDLKPENIMFRDELESEAVLVDLGAASRPGALWMGTGSKGWAAPELYQDNAFKVGPSADVFALGLLLYTFTTGFNPFHLDTSEECRRAAQVAFQDYHFADDDGYFASGIGKGLRELCEAMAQPIPSHRISMTTAVRRIADLRDNCEAEFGDLYDPADDCQGYDPERPNPWDTILDMYLSMEVPESELVGFESELETVLVGEAGDLSATTTTSNSWEFSGSSNTGSTGVMPSSPNNQSASPVVVPHQSAAFWGSLKRCFGKLGSTSRDRYPGGFEARTKGVKVVADDSIPSGKPGFGHPAKALGKRFKRLFVRAA